MIIDSLSLMECVANTLLISVAPMLIVSLTEYKYGESKLMKHSTEILFWCTDYSACS